MSYYGPIPGYSNKEARCRYCLDISLKVAGIATLGIIVIIFIIGSIYGIKMYKQVSPLLILIKNNINNITEVFNIVSTEILVYGNNITRDVNNVTSEFGTFSNNGLMYIKTMTNDLNKIAARIG